MMCWTCEQQLRQSAVHLRRRISESIFIAVCSMHAYIRRRQNRTVYSVLNRKQNLRSTQGIFQDFETWGGANQPLGSLPFSSPFPFPPPSLSLSPSFPPEAGGRGCVRKLGVLTPLRGLWETLWVDVL